MTLKEAIFERFKMSHYGKKRAIKIRDLLFDIQELWDYSEREMRAAYEDLPICGSSKGLYLPETQVEIDEQVSKFIWGFMERHTEPLATHNLIWLDNFSFVILNSDLTPIKMCYNYVKTSKSV